MADVDAQQKETEEKSRLIASLMEVEAQKAEQDEIVAEQDEKVQRLRAVVKENEETKKDRLKLRRRNFSDIELQPPYSQNLRRSKHVTCLPVCR